MVDGSHGTHQKIPQGENFTHLHKLPKLYCLSKMGKGIISNNGVCQYGVRTVGYPAILSNTQICSQKDSKDTNEMEQRSTKSYNTQ
jgi:hypothetical protein